MPQAGEAFAEWLAQNAITSEEGDKRAEAYARVLGQHKVATPESQSRTIRRLSGSTASPFASSSAARSMRPGGAA
jgi:hypothetical protein